MFPVEVGRVYMGVEGGETNRMRRVVGIRREGGCVTTERGQRTEGEYDTVFWVNDATGRLHSPMARNFCRAVFAKGGFMSAPEAPIPEEVASQAARHARTP